jgi:hypothetical protein
LRIRHRAHQVVTQSAANQVRTLFGERKFSRHPTNSVGPEQLSLLAHKKDFRENTNTANRDDKRGCEKGPSPFDWSS